MKSELGRSLIEVLGVLAIAAVMTAAAYKTYNSLRTNQLRNLALSEMEQIARNTKILMETRGDYTGVSIEYLIKMGAITNADAPLGGENWYITSGVDGKSFSINLTDLTNSDCVYFATKKIKWANKVSVNKIEGAGAESCISAPRNFVSFIVE
jgi:Tfp pilus assembly protein PilV